MCTYSVLTEYSYVIRTCRWAIARPSPSHRRHISRYQYSTAVRHEQSPSLLQPHWRVGCRILTTPLIHAPARPPPPKPPRSKRLKRPPTPARWEPLSTPHSLIVIEGITLPRGASSVSRRYLRITCRLSPALSLSPAPKHWHGMANPSAKVVRLDQYLGRQTNKWLTSCACLGRLGPQVNGPGVGGPE